MEPALKTPYKGSFMSGLISVIMPVYNGQGYIRRAVKSILQQTYRNWELLIISDDLQDYSPFLPGDPRIRLLSSGRKGSGPSNARNVGLAVARGDYVAAVDADDEILPERFEKLLPLAKEWGAACDNMVSVDEDSGEVVGKAFPALNEKFQTVGLDDVADLNRPFVPVFARAIVKPWNASVGFSEDALYNLQAISQTDGMRVLNEGLYRYTVRSDSLSHSMPSSYFAAKRAYETILGFLRSQPELISSDPRALRVIATTFRRKSELNEAFWNAYRSGKCAHFTEFDVSSPC